MATRSPRTPARSSSATAAPAGAPEATAPNAADSIQSVKHNARRKNIPPAGIEAQGQVQEAPRVRYAYNPHLPPRLRFSNDPASADRLPDLLQTARTRALTEAEAQELADALRRHEPWLEWAGKRERPWFEVEPPALHIHDRVSTQAMLRVLARWLPSGAALAIYDARVVLRSSLGGESAEQHGCPGDREEEGAHRRRPAPSSCGDRGPPRRARTGRAVRRHGPRHRRRGGLRHDATVHRARVRRSARAGATGAGRSASTLRAV